ncbi:hypothetical protein BDV06DRAFT_231674 [Aspergillus oleicola]
MLPDLPLGLLATALIAFSSQTTASGTWSNTSAATGYLPCDALIAVATLFNVNDGAGDWHIALRAGGHNYGTSNNVERSVTIDLKYLNSTSYDKVSNTASLGPGAKWQDVYAALQKHGVVTTGGQDGDVGVGVGGASGATRLGTFEVVLVNDTIINANKNEHAYLWRALKGSGRNFGIVTRYDVEAYLDKKFARGTREMSANYTGQFATAVSDFTSKQENKDDVLVAILAHVEVNIDGVENSAGFSRFKVQPLYQAALDSSLPGDAWALQTTLTFKNDQKILSHAAAAHKRFATSLESAIGKGNFYSIIFFQLLPSFFADIAAQKKKNGNMFADTLWGDIVLWTAGVFVYTNQSDFAVASARMQKMLVYLNYADFVQDPLGSYPEESYDAEGKFQEVS